MVTLESEHFSGQPLRNGPTLPVPSFCKYSQFFVAGRPDLADPNNYLNEIAIDTPHRTLQEALVGADVFLGVSAARLLTPEMLNSTSSYLLVFHVLLPPAHSTAPGAGSDSGLWMEHLTFLQSLPDASPFYPAVHQHSRLARF